MTARLHHLVYMVLLGSFCCSLNTMRVLLRRKEGEDVRPFFKSQKGFIFIDALVGMVILIIALTAIISAFTQTTKATSVSTNYNQAMFLAQQTIEDIKIQDGGSQINLSSITSPVSRNNVAFTITATNISVTDATLDAKVKPVQVTVTWNDPVSSSVRQVIIVSYYYTK